MNNTTTTTTTTKATRNEGVKTFSPEQLRAIDSVVNQGKSVFITGPAGAGKSFVLNEIITQLQRKYGAECVFVTATTGIAATHVGGITVHSMSGTGINIDNLGDVVTRVDRNKTARENWKKCIVLIIDEISMMSHQYLECLDYVARTIRRDGRPMGGIQLVFTGDFLQLPPVVKGVKTRKYIFDSDIWKKIVKEVIILKRVFRQMDEGNGKIFKQMLACIRVGNVMDEHVAVLRGLKHQQQQQQQQPQAKADGPNGNGNDLHISMTRLYCKRVQVDDENTTHLKRLKGEERLFKGRIDGVSQYAKDTLVKNCIAPMDLKLKVGAQVMLLQNIAPPLLVNGSRGVVIGFDDENGGGMPMVEFACGETMTMDRNRWETKKGKEVQAVLTQIPLTLAWALTIHKCQGMTLDRVELDIAECWEPGQAYVALSRCRSLEGMSIISVDRNRIKADTHVIKYLASVGDETAKEELDRRGAVLLSSSSSTTTKASTNKEGKRIRSDNKDDGQDMDKGDDRAVASMKNKRVKQALANMTKMWERTK